MRLWIDGQCLQSVSRLRGIGRYVSEFLGAIHEFHSDVALEISFNAALAAEAVMARDFVKAWIPDERIHLWQGVADVGEAHHGNTDERCLSELALAHHVACIAPDIALSASPFEGMVDECVPFLQRGPVRCATAALFFDAIPFRFSDRYLGSTTALTAYERRLHALGSFDVLLAISNFSRAEALELEPSAHVVNVDAGVSAEFVALAQRPADPIFALSLGVRSPYMLYVGGLDWRKNVGRVVDAFIRLPSATRDKLQFVIAGDYPPSAERAIVTQWNGSGLAESKLRMLGHIPDATLVQLYKQAHLVIQPSLMEGFGLTALEAMTCGTPVLAANAGALPEVLDNPDALFDPDKPADMAQRIHRAISEPAFREQLIERSRERARFYSWSRSAGLAVDALRATVARRRDGGTSSTVDDPASIRAQTYALTRSLKLPSFSAIRLLAAAEPDAPGPRRLLVDVTSTCLADHATGIQRVVNRIAANLTTGADLTEQVQLSFCDSADGMFEAGIRDRQLVVADVDHRKPIRFNPSDRVLMLDSSWEFYEAHQHVLLKARLQGCPVISTLFDLVPLTLPAFCDAGMPPVFARWLEGALRRSTAFVCISRAVADELFALLNALRFPRRMQIGYWHLGADFHAGTQAAAPQKKLPHPSFLMVGTLEPRKGHRIAFEAFDQLWKKGFQGSLVLAGKRGWGVDGLVAAMTKHREYGKRLLWIDGPSDATLQSLYDGCDALVATSFGEGFGLPLVEAAFHNKPVIASDLPVFREVTSSSPAAIFFETGSAVSLAAAIERFVADQPNYVSLASTAKPWITWAESALQLEEVVRGDRWYRTYDPPASSSSPDATSIGHIAMLRALTPSEQKGTLEIVDGPTPSGVKGKQSITLKMSNLSETLWSSRGTSDGRFGICIGCRVLDRDSNVVKDDHVRATIPFVLPPRESQYLTLSVDSAYWKLDAASIDIEIVQEGVAWWGDPLQLPV